MHLGAAFDVIPDYVYHHTALTPQSCQEAFAELFV